MAPGTIYCLCFTVNRKEFQIQHMITIMLKSHVQFDGKKLCQSMMLWSSCSGIHAQFGEKKLYQSMMLWSSRSRIHAQLNVKKLYQSINSCELEFTCNLRCVLCFLVLHVHEDVRLMLQVPSKARPLIRPPVIPS